MFSELSHEKNFAASRVEPEMEMLRRVRDNDKRFEHIIGDEALKCSSLAHNTGDDTVEFLVTSEKQRNYVEYCDGLIPALDPVQCINKYTDHTTQLFAHVNLSLAADSPAIKDHARYVVMDAGSNLGGSESVFLFFLHLRLFRL